MSSLLPGQSIARVKMFTSSWSPFEDQHYTFWLIKETVPSPGTLPFQSDSKGIFSGYVFDSQHNPIKNLNLLYCWSSFFYYNFWDISMVITDTNGYFYNDVIYGRKYNLDICHNTIPYNKVINTIFYITIEPDSNNYYEFILDTLLSSTGTVTEKKNIEINVFPNPSDGEVQICLHLPANDSKVIAKIFNTEGEIIRIIPFEKPNKDDNYLIIWDGKCFDSTLASGIFYVNVEIENRRIASEKIMIIR